MIFYFRITSIVVGFTVAVHMSREPSSMEKPGRYLKIEADNEEEVMKKLKHGPPGNGTWKFVHTS